MIEYVVNFLKHWLYGRTLRIDFDLKTMAMHPAALVRLGNARQGMRRLETESHPGRQALCSILIQYRRTETTAPHHRDPHIL